MARGLLTADGFAAIRSLVEGRTGRTPSPTRSVSRRRRGARYVATTAAGRWSLVPPVEPVDDRESLAEVVADQLLQRWGVVFRDLAVHEGLPVPWRDVQWALRRFEDRGLVRGAASSPASAASSTPCPRRWTVSRPCAACPGRASG